MSANIDWSSRKVIGCDGTTANIGNPGKVIKWLEKMSSTKVHLHADELPRRHLFNTLERTTFGRLGYLE